MYRLSTSLTATRDMVIAGSPVAAGDVLTGNQMESIKTLHPLIAKGMLVVDPDPYARKTRSGNPQPTYLNPGAYGYLVGASTPLGSAPPPPPAPPSE